MRNGSQVRADAETRSWGFYETTAPSGRGDRAVWEGGSRVDRLCTADVAENGLAADAGEVDQETMAGA